MRKNQESNASVSIVHSAMSSLGAAFLPWLLACIAYLVVAALIMPIRFQLGIRVPSIFPGGGPAWIDVALGYLIVCSLSLLQLPLARQTADLLGRNTLGVLSALMLTPTYTFIGRWFWEPAAASASDSSTGGSMSSSRVGVFLLLVTVTLIGHVLLALVATLTFSIPVWYTMLIGRPTTIPCIAIGLMGHPQGLIRVKCDPLPAGQWYDEDALYFFTVLCLLWAVASILLGTFAMVKAGISIKRFS